jgi:carbonic anhydrase
MTTIDDVLARNNEYAREFKLGHLPMPPARKLAILACMDARLTLESMLGLKTGDAHIIRNAGGIATEDALRSLLISCHLLGTREFMVINHTDCGMLTFTDQELRERLHRETGELAIAPAQFCAFPDLERNVQEQVQKIRSHPWIPEAVIVRGYIYDVKSGGLREVRVEMPRHKAA